MNTGKSEKEGMMGKGKKKDEKRKMKRNKKEDEMSDENILKKTNELQYLFIQCLIRKSSSFSSFPENVQLRKQ